MSKKTLTVYVLASQDEFADSGTKAQIKENMQTHIQQCAEDYIPAVVWDTVEHLAPAPLNRLLEEIKSYLSDLRVYKITEINIDALSWATTKPLLKKLERGLEKALEDHKDQHTKRQDKEMIRDRELYQSLYNKFDGQDPSTL